MNWLFKIIEFFVILPGTILGGMLWVSTGTSGKGSAHTKKTMQNLVVSKKFRWIISILIWIVLGIFAYALIMDAGVGESINGIGEDQP